MLNSRKLTAKKAREITKASDPSQALDSILRGIEEMAKKGKYEYITRDFGFGSGGLYAPEKDYPELNKVILKELRDLGYDAQVVVEEKQFVDIKLKVTWDDEQ